MSAARTLLTGTIGFAVEHVAQNSAICEICERARPELGAIVVRKTIDLRGTTLVDFVICDPCAMRIAVILEKLEHGDRAAVRDPPPEASKASGGDL